MKRLRMNGKLLTLFALTSATLFTVGQESYPDCVLVHGKIFTANASQPYVEALAIRGARIIAAGPSDEVMAMAGPQTKRIELEGRLVIPGINDAHYHLPIEPTSIPLVLQTEDPSWQEVKEALTQALAKAPTGALITGTIGPAVLDDPQANRTILDALAPSRAVVLRTWTGNSMILNTAAMRKLGVHENEPDPIGGHFVRSPEDGKLTGVAHEFAAFRLHRKLSMLAGEEEALRETQKYLSTAARLGITSVQVMSMPPSPKLCLSLFQKAHTPIRVRIMRYLLTNRFGRVRNEGRELASLPSRLITVSGTKWVLDGTPIERTAALRQPYADRPQVLGEMNFYDKEMQDMLLESLQNHDQLLVHAVGDRTIETFLHAMDATGGKAVWSGRRVRIEHGDGLLPDLVPRAKDLGVIVVQNPTHLALGELMTSRFGQPGMQQRQPLRSLLNAGIPVALGSDGPLNPYLNIMLASIYPGKPEEALTREQAVTAYTLTAAYAELAEKDKGSLQPGKLADLAVLSQDIFQAPANDLPKTVSLLTMVGGRIICDAKVLNVSQEKK